jgi:Domain of unknown function (DUF4870)
MDFWWRNNNRLNQVGQNLPLSAKKRAGRDERMAASFCHLSILLNLFTQVGGLVVCAFFYLLAHRRNLFLEEQAGRAFIGQCVVWGITGAGWLFYRLLPDWLGNLIFLPLGALVWFFAILIAMWRAIRCL